MSRKQSQDLSDFYAREVDVDMCSKTLKIYQKIEGDVNSVVWDASLVLAKYLEVMCQKMPNLLGGLKVLEIGSGLGLVGITAATLGAQVTLTDLPDSLSLIKVNIAVNKNHITSMGGYAIAEVLSWGDTCSDILQNLVFDYVLIADCIYYEESIEPLINTLLHLNNSSNTKPAIYIAQELRDSDTQKRLWTRFKEKLDANFVVEKIPEENQHQDYRSRDIILLKATKKS